MKRTIIFFLLISAVSFYGNHSKANETQDKSSTSQKVKQSSQPLNLIILLDLSDRLVHNNIVPQKDNDIELIKHILYTFKYNSFHPGPFMKCKNHFQIIFYPSPTGSPQISSLANQMDIDLAPLAAGAKKKAINDAESNIPSALSRIYDQTIQNKKWVGCDIWGLFSYGKIDNICIRKGYRNVLVILSDGYIYHQDNKQKQGNNYSYILPQTLKVSGSGLINGRDKKLPQLNNLEVLILEVNPYDIKDFPKMQNIISNWLGAMGVIKYQIVTTDLPVNTKPVIDNFLK